MVHVDLQPGADSTHFQGCSVLYCFHRKQTPQCFGSAQATALSGAGFSDHDLLFTRPNDPAGAAEPGPPLDTASPQRRGPAVPPARRRAAGTEPACGTAGIFPASLSDDMCDVLRVVTRTRWSVYRPTLSQAMEAGRGLSSAHTSHASAGWGGASELSSLLEKSLTLQPKPSQQADRQPAAAAGTSFWQDSIQRSSAYWSGIVAGKQQPARQGSGDSGQRRSPDDPQARLAKARSLLADAALVAKLPDRGAKLREQVAELERQVHRGQSSGKVAVRR